MMTQGRWDVVWERIRAGRHTMVIGPDRLPAAPSDLQVLRVCCEASSTREGIFDAAHRAVAQLLGEEPLSPEAAREPLTMSTRHRFMGDMPGQPIEALLVTACNRLARRTEGHTALAFEAVDVADETTLATLAQMLQRTGWLQLPLLLTVRGVLPDRLVELVYLLSHEDGDAAVIEIADEAAPDKTVDLGEWTRLPADGLRVLRAGAVLGSPFEAALVAQLLEEPLGRVLEQLQGAADAGVPLTDRGEGQFTLPPGTIAALQSGTLPSLLTFWHARLGEILSGARPAREAGLPSSAPWTGAPGRQAAAGEATGDLAPGRLDTADLAALFEPAHGAVSLTQPAQTTRTPGAAPEERTSSAGQWGGQPRSPSRPSGDAPRAAAHLQAAGRTEAAVAHYLTAVREAVARGDTRRAYAVAEQALTLLNDLPASAQSALLRAQLWLEKGRLQWHGALLGTACTLHEALASLALASLALAKSSLPHDAPPEVVEQLAAVTAGVCYDMGDRAALQRALAELRESSHRLVNAGATLLATYLLNDQAAVYMRLGDPVRATALLAQAHERFESHLRHQPQDRTALAALAETAHLLARLPLHTPMHPGRDQETAAHGLEHARAAEQIYQRLGQPHRLARVWETMGRLALQQGHLEVAQEHLMAALTLQQQRGDVVGLARSTAALAELCMMAGQLGEAVALLADSVALNIDKGSPMGLAFNRQSLGALARAAAQAHGPDAERLRSAVAEVENRLTQAETVLRLGEVPEAVSDEAVAP